MVKAAVIFHQTVEFALARMAKGGMTEIMGKSNRLGEILIESECSRHRATDRGNLNGMRQAGAVVIPFAIEEDLRLAIQTAEGGAMDDAISVSLKAGAKGMFRFGSVATSALAGLLSVGSQKGLAQLFWCCHGMIENFLRVFCSASDLIA